MTWRSTRGAWIEGGIGDLFKGLGIMVLLNQMESFLLRLNDEGWTQGQRVSRSTGEEFEGPTRATVKGEPV